MTDLLPPRMPYQGLLQIFEYNRPFYLRTAVGAITAILLSVYVPPALRILILCGAGIAVLWTCSSLLVSHYIYDQSGLYRLGWLPGSLSRPPRRWINIHAGVDESSLAIHSIFPSAEGQIIDIYDPCKMTEPSIKRARRAAGILSAATDRQELCAPDADCDAVFLIFAAHELRRHTDRVQLFREAARVLRRSGELVFVEHLRDWPNFLAFGPGFLHFFSERTWKAAANPAGLEIKLHRTVTPFVHVFVFQKQE